MIDVSVENLPETLERISDMINLGEKIRWGEETSLMNEAANEIRKLRARLLRAEKMREALNYAEKDLGNSRSNEEGYSAYCKVREALAAWEAGEGR